MTRYCLDCGGVIEKLNKALRCRACWRLYKDRKNREACRRYYLKHRGGVKNDKIGRFEVSLREADILTAYVLDIKGIQISSLKGI